MTVSEQRRPVIIGIALSSVATLILWFALLRWLPPLAGWDSFAVALQCCAIAALLTVVLGVEAIAHERLVTPAIDPLAGVETPRMQVNFRYLSNTVEQYLVFGAGLLAFSAYVGPRVIAAATIAWIVNRWTFWIGYHHSPLSRGWGAPGMMQSMLILLYVGGRFGYEAFGVTGAVLVIAPFLAIEAILFRAPVGRP